MEIYLETKVNEAYVDVNLIVHLERSNMLEAEEMLIRHGLEHEFKRIRLFEIERSGVRGDKQKLGSVDRQTIGRVPSGRHHRNHTPYHHYLAYQGSVEYNNLESILEYIRGLGIHIYDPMPANIKVKLPFEKS